MVCESWKSKLDTYLDSEVSEQEMRSFHAHLKNCPSCSSETLSRVQMKHAIQVAGKRFTPSAEFRKRVQQSVVPVRQRNFRVGWMLASAAVAIVVIGVLSLPYVRNRSGKDDDFSEIADLHVATLASSSPVDVVSTDRHTVKPWFQGKIPFAFNLPELQNSEFSLVGGRMAYLEQTPGAHLVYDYGKHHISVFIFQERSLQADLYTSTLSPVKLTFNTETWTEGGLRYFVIGDASSADIAKLAKLFKGTS